MTKSEFEELQVRAASCGTTLKEFLHVEGVAYSTYNYWNKKLKMEAKPMPIAPISIHKPTVVEKTEHAGTASGVEKCLKMAIGLKNTAIDYQIVAF